MAIEIVSFPIKKRGLFHSFLYAYQRVICIAVTAGNHFYHRDVGTGRLLKAGKKNKKAHFPKHSVRVELWWLFLVPFLKLNLVGVYLPL